MMKSPRIGRRLRRGLAGALVGLVALAGTAMAFETEVLMLSMEQDPVGHAPWL